MTKKRFMVSRTFRFVKRFKVRKESWLERLFGIREREEEGEKKKKKKKMNPYILTALLTLLLIGGTVGYFMMLLSMSQGGAAYHPYVEGELKNVVFGNYGDFFSKRFGIAAFITSSVKSADELRARVYKLNHDISLHIYILRCGKYNSERNYVGFLRGLEKYKKKGFAFSEVEAEEVSRLPKGSIVVMPCGRFPYELIDRFSPSLTKGLIFVYIGGKPLKAIAKNNELKDMPSNFWENVGVEFEDKKVLAEGLHLEEGSFKIRGSTPIRGLASSKRIGKGVFLLIPLELDEWKEGEEAAEDVMEIVESFVKLDGELVKDVGIIPGKTAVVFSSQNRTVFLLELAAIKGEEESKKFMVGMAENDLSGYLYPEQGPSVLPMHTSKRPIRFYYRLEGEGSYDDVYLKVIDKKGRVVDKKVLNHLPIGDEGSFDYYNENLTDGTYVFELKGKKEYARSILQIAPLRVEIKPNFEKAKFLIEFYVGDNKVKLEKVKVRFKDKVFEGEGVRFMEIDLYDYFGGKVPSGWYEFEVEAGKTKKVVKTYNPPKTALGRILFNNPINMALLTLAIIIFFIGSLIKPRDEKIFTIDIPDFPAVEKSEVKVRVSDFVDVFEEVNGYYKWKHTPLKLSEIKAGFRRGIGGKSILISDYNLEYLLEKLKQKGVVKEALGYYGLTKWEKETGFSIEELALFRAVRDICLEFAVPFSKLSKRRYNVEIKLLFSKAYIIFYTGKKPAINAVRKALSLVGESPVIILTPGEEEKQLFMEKIFSSANEMALFRYYLERGMVSVLTVEEFRRKLKELE